MSRLPEDITEEEFAELMGKCGMVEHDIRTKKSKLKLYKDKNGMPKGDGLCSYIKAESVELALTILDGSEFKVNVIFFAKTADLNLWVNSFFFPFVYSAMYIVQCILEVLK